MNTRFFSNIIGSFGTDWLQSLMSHHPSAAFYYFFSRAYFRYYPCYGDNAFAGGA